MLPRTPCLLPAMKGQRGTPGFPSRACPCCAREQAPDHLPVSLGWAFQPLCLTQFSAFGPPSLTTFKSNSSFRTTPSSLPPGSGGPNTPSPLSSGSCSRPPVPCMAQYKDKHQLSTKISTVLGPGVGLRTSSSQKTREASESGKGGSHVPGGAARGHLAPSRSGWVTLG